MIHNNLIANKQQATTHTSLIVTFSQILVKYKHAACSSDPFGIMVQYLSMGHFKKGTLGHHRLSNGQMKLDNVSYVAITTRSYRDEHYWSRLAAGRNWSRCRPQLSSGRDASVWQTFTI